jgi:cytochrome c-type biogenesis protein CcmH
MTTARRAAWFVMAAIVVVTLARATFDDGPPRTTEDKVEAIAATLKCPVCRSQSVADSDVAASRAIRLEITKRVEEGQPASVIRAEIASTYGDQVQLLPPSSGFAGLVWIIPVVAVVVALVALSAVFARWRRTPDVAATDDDRALVERALHDR